MAPLLPPSDEVHVWRGRVSAAATARLSVHLGEAERARASRFVRERDRQRFLFCRGMQRELLGRYLGQPPRALRFGAGPWGKPHLEGTAPGLRFSVSHSGEATLLALALGREVGVDVEQLREDLDPLELARTALSAPEQAALRALPPEARQAAFFACWTRKEACIKLVGMGVSYPLDAFDVEVDARRPPALLAARAAPLAGLPLQLLALQAPPGYAAALAVEGGPVRLVERDFGAE